MHVQYVDKEWVGTWTATVMQDNVIEACDLSKWTQQSSEAYR